MGGPSKQEQAQQQQSWAGLNSLASTASTQAGKSGDAGNSILGDVTSYFKTLLSGDRQATADAVAPAANAAREGADAQKKQEAQMGTGRTGGTVAQDQQREDATRGQIDTLTAGVKPQAAQALTAIGAGDINAMMSALGIGTTATGTVGSQVGSDINTQRQAAADMWGSLIGGAGSVLGGAASAGKLFGI